MRSSGAQFWCAGLAIGDHEPQPSAAVEHAERNLEDMHGFGSDCVRACRIIGCDVFNEAL
jgi:hypothetical protein